MPIKLSSLAVDLTRETEGDWVDLPDLPGVRLKTRSLHYAPYRVARDSAFVTLSRKHGKTIPAEASDTVLRKLCADHLLLDWDGFDVPYTHEAALTVLTDPAFREFVSHVLWAAAQVGQAEIAFVESAEKNSPMP